MSTIIDRVVYCTESEKCNLFQTTISNYNKITLEFTVDTGFEFEAWGETMEKFNHESNKDVLMCQGRVYTTIDVDQYHIVRQLRSIDNIYLVSDINSDMQFLQNGLDGVANDDQTIDLQKIKNYAKVLQLERYVKTYAQLTNFKGNIFPSELEHARAKEIKQRLDELKNGESDEHPCSDAKNLQHDVLRYRVTCHRIGTHSFTSNEAATAFGGILNDVYQWVVDLSNYDVEIVLYIRQNEASVLFRLSKASLHKRMLTEFGNTSLRPTISYNMLRMAKIKDDDVVLDPLCGSGSIVLESLQAFPNAKTICGDIDEIAVKLTTLNIRNAAPSLPNLIECHSWDATSLPLTTGTVDVVCTDLPFGKRCGKRSNNTVLYPALFKEFARVLRAGGRLVLLSYDRKNLEKALRAMKSELSFVRTINANVGGLKTVVAVCKRTKFINPDSMNLSNDNICER